MNSSTKILLTIVSSLIHGIDRPRRVSSRGRALQCIWDATEIWFHKAEEL